MVDGLAEKERNEAEERERIKVYLAVAAVLVVLAVISLLLVPHPSNSLEGCREIVLQQNRDSCLEYLASSTRNATVCSYIASPYSDYCYAEVAELSSNPGECRMISNYNQTYSCVVQIANSTDSYGDCGYLNGSYRSYCIESLALKLDNATACSSIANATEAGVCASAVYFGRARSAVNATYCSLVSNTSESQVVTRILSLSERMAGAVSNFSFGFGNINPTEYMELGNSTFAARDLCYLTVATSGEPLACRSISNGTLESICNSSAYAAAPVSNLTENYTMASKVCSGYTGKNLTSCNALISITQAISSRNATVCTGIGNLSFRYQCYETLARAYNDTGYCGYISNATANQACVQDINYNVTQ